MNSKFKQGMYFMGAMITLIVTVLFIAKGLTSLTFEGFVYYMLLSILVGMLSLGFLFKGRV